MKLHILLTTSLLFCATFLSTAQEETPFKGNTSVTYDEAIAQYQRMAQTHQGTFLMEYGKTDVGRPLHLFVINKGGDQDPNEFDNSKSVLFINNGIHPGEPCGVDASLKLAMNLLNGGERYNKLLDSTIVCIVPMYNVGGSLNRGCCVRANQNGPEEYGFRGNARNLDLNRDFIKADSRNAQSFFRMFQDMQPEVFIDTHTSNGADYQYVMTMISTQPDKASEEIGSYIRNEMSPALFATMNERGWGMTPYVFTLNKIPDNGIKDFLETPRFSTGYAALFNTIGFTSETHMLKPFAQRVESTYQFLLASLDYMYAHNTELIQQKERADKAVADQKTFELNWELDTTSFRKIPFNGFAATYEKSKVTSADRLKYDRSQPQTINIKYYDTYQATETAAAPAFYVVPQAWREVVDRLKWNGVELTQLKKDSIAQMRVYYIDDYEAGRVYEGHRYTKATVVREVVEEVQLFKGDYLVEVNQTANRYIVETLEPKGVDSFFSWNFFDSVLQQKEWYSDYVFEDSAAEMLENDPALKKEFEQAKKEDKELADSPRAQLYWLYKKSIFFEGTVNRYPIFKSLN